MAAQNQDTVACNVFSDLKTTLSTYTEVTEFMHSFNNRYETIMGEMYQLEDDDIDGRLSLLQNLKAVFDYGSAKSTNIQEYNLIQKGSVHVKEGKVICDGKSMDWNAFCAVRNEPATILECTDVVNVGGYEMELDQYLAARKAHRHIPDKQASTNEGWAPVHNHSATTLDNWGGPTTDWNTPPVSDTYEEWNGEPTEQVRDEWEKGSQVDSYDGYNTPSASAYNQDW